MKRATEIPHNHYRLALILFCLLSAYYLIKPVSKALFISTMGSENLPFVWISSFCVIMVLTPIYRLQEREQSSSSVLWFSILSSVFLLLTTRILYPFNPALIAVVLAVVVDVYSLVLIEKAWQLFHSLRGSESDQSSLSLLTLAAPLGATVGSIFSYYWINSFKLAPLDLITTGLLFLLISTVLIPKKSPEEVQDSDALVGSPSDKEPSRALIYLAVIVVLCQTLHPFIDFLFLSHIEDTYPDVVERSVQVSLVFFASNSLALVLNFALFLPWGNRTTLSSMLSLHPAIILGCGLIFLTFPLAPLVYLMKISDRALAYSLFRSAKEQHYRHLGMTGLQWFKNWIDIFGTRLSKLVCSLALLLLISTLGRADALLAVTFITSLIALGALLAYSRVSSVKLKRGDKSDSFVAPRSETRASSHQNWMH